ncbi:MAG: hypothetical protein WCQ48_06810 [Chloroflexota bacterium]
MTSDADDTSFGGWRACDVCGESIGTIEEAALALRASLLEERRAASATVNPEGYVPWDWGHRPCLDALAPLHVIEGPRMNTLPRMMARTLQLLDEEWFGETAWEDAVRRFYRIPFE